MTDKHSPIHLGLLGDARLPGRFWDKIVVDDQSGCWLWRTYEQRPDGYAGFQDENKRIRPAHRYSYEHLVGPVPDGLVLDHEVCGRPPCVRPDGLVPKTINRNGQRERGDWCRSGRHRLIPDNVILQKTDNNGQQLCKTCRNEKRREERRSQGRALYDVQTVTHRIEPGWYASWDGTYEIKRSKIILKGRPGYDQQWGLYRQGELIGQFPTRAEAIEAMAS